MDRPLTRSLKHLHIAGLAGVFTCLSIAIGAGYLLFSDLNPTPSPNGWAYILFILISLGTVLSINVSLYRSYNIVRSDIDSLVQMFRDIQRGTVSSNHPVILLEFATAQRHLLGWGREMLVEKEQLRDMGMLDHLSQLSNRRHFEARLKEVFDKAKTHGPSSVLIIDADHFKQVNDQYGHDAGDTLIVRLAAALRDNVRSTDMLARIGGDEFCIVFTYASLRKAGELAARLRQNLPREIELKPELIHALRWTGGLSAIHSSDTKPEDVLWRADQALLYAKESGRHRTVIYDPVSGLPGSARIVSC